MSRKRQTDLIRGRFEGRPAEIMERINASIDFDRRLWRQDIDASKAHCAMLMETGCISKKDGRAILKGLDAIAGEIERGAFRFDPALEDIHMNIEARLKRLIGAPAGRLHTARSRNDQVATDFRLWVRDALDGLDGHLKALQETLIERAEEHAATVMAGYTHLQPAQPVTLGHHLLAYVEMLGRDRGRLGDARARLNECPLGAAALAGTSFPIDRKATARALGFAKPSANSMDAVSDRDFAMEALSLAAITAVHLSRLAEELVIWSSVEFGYITLSDAFTTGSSIMPQKRNADGAELVRAKSGRVIGDLVTLLTVMKGLALSYAKDMQEDKEPVFDALDSLDLAVQAMSGMIADMQIHVAVLEEGAHRGHASATDLADWLVRRLDMPFRDAHRLVGRIVRRAETKGVRLEDLGLDEFRRLEARITADVFTVLSPERAVASRASYGGTAPRRVRAAVRAARRRFL